jgi:hypothetical protein
MHEHKEPFISMSDLNIFDRLQNIERQKEFNGDYNRFPDGRNNKKISEWLK